MIELFDLNAGCTCLLRTQSIAKSQTMNWDMEKQIVLGQAAGNCWNIIDLVLYFDSSQEKDAQLKSSSANSSEWHTLLIDNMKITQVSGISGNMSGQTLPELRKLIRMMKELLWKILKQNINLCSYQSKLLNRVVAILQQLTVMYLLRNIIILHR